MILNENFVILEEDEDIDDEVLSESLIFDEDVDILLEAPITSASSVNKEASSSSLNKAKSAIDKKIASGKYRAYKSSDKNLLDKAIKDKNMLKTAAMAIAGSALGAVGAYKGTQLATRKTSQLSNSTALSTKVKMKSIGMKKEEYDMFLNEAINFYLDESFEEVLNEKLNIKKPDVNKALNKAKSVNKVMAGATAGGAVAGATAGTALAKKILSGMKYTVFTMNGLTILSLYSTSKEGEAKGKSVCYALATAVDGSKLYMHRVNLKSN